MSIRTNTLRAMIFQGRDFFYKHTSNNYFSFLMISFYKYMKDKVNKSLTY
nr:MAG TPA: hypothetical protein [Caudoviricetes sp.]